MMGDDKTLLKVAGYGFMTYRVGQKLLRHEGYFIPQLGTTLYSVKQHMRSQGCYFLGLAQETHLAFPTFIISPTVDNEIELMIHPISTSDQKPSFDFDESTA